MSKVKLLMGKLRAFIKLMRPINCVIMGFAVFVGVILAGANISAIFWSNIVFGFFTGFTLCAASMAINDYYDRKIDAINEPARPIPSGLISPQEALGLAVVLSVIGLVFAALVSFPCLIVALVAYTIMMAYMTVGKRSGLPGNFLVSACVAAPFVYGSIIARGFVVLNVWFFVSMAFLANTGREITKGIVDVEGDRTENVRTLAVRFGEKVAGIVAVIFFISAVALTPVPLILRLVSLWFIPFVLVIDVGLLFCSGLLLVDHSREKARRIKNLVLFLFIFGLLAFIFGQVI
ncbi:MAG TPA: geranylgeranylglycerol-phosphate geranylgeranyltransferase [Candidatus Sulfotelmatobacter sp.]|nr:geranylgeranylglycerol-phosphate geranylgeranyltransferase [Candidatus Sulfotelmatobacter sp.]